MNFIKSFQKKTSCLAVLAAVIFGIPGSVHATAFTPGDLVVFLAAASASNTSGSVVEINAVTAGGAVQTIPINGTTTPNELRFSGSASSTGYLADTDDGTLVVFTGVNTTDTADNVNTLPARGVGAFNSAGTYILQTTYTAGVSGGTQARGATSVNNTTWWIGDQSGFFSNGSTSASPAGNFRSIRSFGGTVYALQTASGTIVVSTISAATGGTATGLSGLARDANAVDFYLVKSGANGATYDTLYVLDNAGSATAASIVKYALVSGTWTAKGTYSITTFGGFGLCATTDGSGGAFLYVTSGTGATTANSVVKLDDTAAWNATINITTANNATLYTAGAGTILKGIAFAPVSFTVTYDGNTSTGGTVPTDANSPYASGATVTVLGNTGSLVKTGSTFAGWNTAANGSGTAYSPGSTFAISADTTLYAQWAPTYTVTYDGNGNTGGTVPIDNNAYTSGATVTVLANAGVLVKSGFTFGGWNTATDGSGTTYAATGSATFTMGAANVTLYALWTTSPSIAVTGSPLNFGALAVNSTSASLSYTVSGANLTDANGITINAPANYQISTDNSIFSSQLVLPQTAGTVPSTTIYVQFQPTALTSYPATVMNTSSGASEQDVAVSGVGASAPVVTTQGATNIATNGAAFNGTVTASNNAVITDRGFYYKTTPGVSTADTQVSEGGVTQAAYLKAVTGLSPNQIYYYRAYAANAIGMTLDSGMDETSFYTLANPPTAPTVSAPTQSSLNVAIGAGDGNPPATTYAIQEKSSSQYVQANGTLGGSAVYNTASTWGTVTVTGLNRGAFYTFQVKAQNGAGTVTSFSAATSASTTALTLTPGNLVVERVGNGVETLSSGGNTIFLDEFTSAGSSVQSIQIPDSGSSSLIESGTAGSDGAMTRSADGSLLCVPGYNTSQPFGSSLTSAAGTTVPRAIGTVNTAGTFALAVTSTTADAANNIRGAAGDGSGNYWCSGGGTGLDYLGNVNSAGNIYSTVSNLRCVNAIGANLWFDTSSGSSTRGIWEFNGSPTSTATPTRLIPIGANDSPYNFSVDDAANPTTLYYADDGTQGNGSGAGIHKWVNSGGTWSLAYVVYSSSGVFGLAVDWSTMPPTIYATTTNSANSLIKIVDNGANSTATVLATAPAGEFYRGIAFAPKGSSAIIVASSENPSGYITDSVTFTATVTPSTAGGNVIFEVNGAPFSTNALSGGVATSLGITSLPRGNDVITAEYAGDNNYVGSTNILTGGQTVTNHPPVLAPLSVTRTAGFSLKVFWSQITNQWSDIDGDTVMLAGISLTTTNNVTITTNDAVIMYPADAPNAADQINYTATDGQGAVVNGVINITLQPATLFGQQSPQMAADGNGQVQVTFYGIPGYTYVIQRSPDLNSWTDLSTNTATSQNPAITFTDDVGIGGHAFYRLEWLQ